MWYVRESYLNALHSVVELSEREPTAAFNSNREHTKLKRRKKKKRTQNVRLRQIPKPDLKYMFSLWISFFPSHVCLSNGRLESVALFATKQWPTQCKHYALCDRLDDFYENRERHTNFGARIIAIAVSRFSFISRSMHWITCQIAIFMDFDAILEQK